MTRRGLTLIEVLLSLTLLSSLAIATVSWTASTAAIEARRTAVSDQLAAEALLERMIQIDLMNDDPSLTAATNIESRVWLTADTLHVLTRASGPKEVRYHLDQSRGDVSRTLVELNGEEPQREDLVLAACLDFSWSVSRDEDRGLGTIAAHWTRPDGSSASLEIMTPLEWMP